jgi:glycosyltransferase involved in cell wall biosynthesis
MRLAYLSTDSGIRFGGAKGAAVHVEQLTTAFADAGAEVLLLIVGCAPDAPPPAAGVTVDVLPAVERGSWLEERLRGFQPDVLYERLALHSGIGIEAARALGIPHLVELNAPLVAEAERYRGLEHPEDADRLERETLAEADAVLAVSAPLADHARARGARRVEVVPNAVDPVRYPANERDARSRPVAVFAGALRPWHGLDCIAEAWALLGDAPPALLVVGDGPDRALLEGVGARVTGAVPHAHVPRLLAEADIGLAPYAADAPDYFSPLKLFEYLAAGLATVAGDIPGVRDVVGKEAAVVVPPGDARALADAVSSLASDPERRRRLGDAGRALVFARHTWDHRARTILVLARALARQPAGATA